MNQDSELTEADVALGHAILPIVEAIQCFFRSSFAISSHGLRPFSGAGGSKRLAGAALSRSSS
jgi:hypothetical protein